LLAFILVKTDLIWNFYPSKANASELLIHEGIIVITTVYIGI